MEKPNVDENKLKALESAVAQIEKAYGDCPSGRQ